MAFLFGVAHDYNDFVRQVRGFCCGHPQVLKSDPKDSQSGITITGTGNGTLFVSTELGTPAGTPGSPAGSPGPGTKYRLTCTVAGNAVTSPRAQFTVEQIGVSPSVLGTLTAGDRWRPDGDEDPTSSPQLGSPLGLASPQHGLQLHLDTTTNWAVSDTIEFRLVDHNIGPDSTYNAIEQRYLETLPDGNGDFSTQWLARFPSVANVAGSPITPFYTGLQTDFDDGAGWRNVGVIAATDFEPSNAFNAQPGNGGIRYAFLQQNSFAFWLVATADGFYAVANPGSVYEHITAHLLDVFATGNQHPLPIYFGAMSEIATGLPSETDSDKHAMPLDPGDESSARFRWVDGSWFNVENRTGVYSKAVAPTLFVWPYKSDQSGGNHTDGASLNTSYTWDRLSHQMLARYDGSYELLPCTLIGVGTPQTAVIGDLKFVKYVTGNGINSEDTTTDTTQSPNQEYIALQNAQLVDNDNFMALELVE